MSSSRGKSGKAGSKKRRSEPKRKVRVPVRELMLESRLGEMRDRSVAYTSEIDRLRTEAKKRQVLTQEWTRFLESEVRRKDEEHLRVVTQLKELCERQAVEQKSIQTHYEKLLQQQEKIFLQQEKELLERNKALMQEVSDLGLFRQLRVDLANELQQTKDMIVANQSKHRQQLQQLEAQFLEARDRLQDEAAARIAHSRQLYKKQVGEELDRESRAVREVNRQLDLELHLQTATCQALLKEHTAISATHKRNSRELSIEKDLGLQSARRSNRLSKHVSALKTRNAELEQSLQVAQRDHQLELQSLREQHVEQLTHVENERDSAQRKLRFREGQLTKLKRHAKLVLQQRSALENFFLQALQVTKTRLLQGPSYSGTQGLSDDSGGGVFLTTASSQPDEADPQDRDNMSPEQVDKAVRLMYRMLLDSRKQVVPRRPTMNLPVHIASAPYSGEGGIYSYGKDHADVKTSHSQPELSHLRHLSHEHTSASSPTLRNSVVSLPPIDSHTQNVAGAAAPLIYDGERAPTPEVLL